MMSTAPPAVPVDYRSLEIEIPEVLLPMIPTHAPRQSHSDRNGKRTLPALILSVTECRCSKLGKVAIANLSMR
jgi:hypothetical protein